jgi:hypothetical protein
MSLKVIKLLRAVMIALSASVIHKSRPQPLPTPSNSKPSHPLSRWCLQIEQMKATAPCTDNCNGEMNNHPIIEWVAAINSSWSALAEAKKGAKQNGATLLLLALALQFRTQPHQGCERDGSIWFHAQLLPGFVAAARQQP